jgi:(p)ppGpp synthase/HD superfamily hydrolase
MDPSTTALTLARADAFAAGAHSGQTRRNLAQSPYIIHPRGVRQLLEQAGITHTPTLAAALLHDTVEDTPVTSALLKEEFGAEISEIVAELTDEKGMPRYVRHAKQAQHASSMSLSAACIKIADRIYNLRDFYAEKPENNTPQSVRDYATYSYTLHDRFMERAEADILNKNGDARGELEKAYLLLLANMKVAIEQLAKKYANA